MRCALTLSALIALAAGCSSKPNENVTARNERGKPVVFASTAPLAEFAGRIGGDVVDVTFPVPAGVDPASWQPADDVVRDMQRADLVLLNGAQLEGWTRRVSLPEDRVVETAKGFVNEFIRVDDFEVHSHGPEGEHSHPGTAPNTWLDPRLAIKQADVVRESLMELVPQAEAEFAERHQSLAADLRTIDEGLEAIIADAPERPVFAAVPFCSYLGRRCHWNIAHLHWSPDEELTEEDWQAFERRRAEHPANVVLWPSPPAERIAKELADRGVESIVIETGANTTGEQNVLDVLRANLDAVRKVQQAQ